MLSRVHDEAVFPRLQVAERSPGMRRRAGHVVLTEVLGGLARMRAREIELVRRRVEERGRRLEPHLSIVVAHNAGFAAPAITPRK